MKKALYLAFSARRITNRIASNADFSSLRSRNLPSRETEFLIEELQPNWLNDKSRFFYRIAAGITVFSIGIIVGFIATLTTGLMVIIFGFMVGIFFGLIAVLAKIEPVDKLDSFSFQKIRRDDWISGLIIGLSLGLMMGLIAW